uniref:MBD domain-containing protein n=1 Tax=Mola mola TaxID=94237 RepID=A0A3Q3XCA8_MOLML
HHAKGEVLTEWFLTGSWSWKCLKWAHKQQLLKMHHTSCDLQLTTSGDINNRGHKDANDLCHTSTMPPGWIREVKQRKAGKTAGKLDIYIISPQGLRFRSRPSLHAFLLQNEELNLDINLFDFTASKGDEVIFPSQVKQRRTRKKHLPHFPSSQARPGCGQATIH